MQPGPPQEPGSEKRILLAFVLTFVVIALMQPLISRYAKPPAEQQKQAQSAPAPTQPSPAVPAPASTETPSVTGAAKQPSSARHARTMTSGPAQAAPQPTRQASAEGETVVESDLYRITFTNRGAQVKSWILKKYDDEKGKPLELVHQAAAQQYGYPLSLWSWDEGLKNKLNSALYVINEDETTKIEKAGESLRAPAMLAFEYSDGELTVRKSFSFDSGYVVRVQTSVEQKGSRVAALVAWPAGFGDQTTAPAYANALVDYQYLDAVERVAIKKISSGNTIRGPLQWAAATDQYFAAVFLPDDPATTSLVTLSNTIKIPKTPDKPDPNDVIQVPVVGMAAGSTTGATAGRFFVGPKAVQVLDDVRATPVSDGGRVVAPDLEKLVDFGRVFGWIARPLFLWLEWTHDHWTSNPGWKDSRFARDGWGWSIVILTVIITVAVAPLRVTSMKSALKMQRVQPQLKAIQEKYKKYKMSDPRRQDMNKEMGELYKREGINPAGGCVPLLLQMPFLVAFYSMLGIAIELRHAHWLWITDLSGPDPLHLLPILIIVSMFWLQKMTPQGGMDPMQQKMMSFMMPVMLGVMSWSLPAGLSVYWLFSQVLSIGQQYWINQTEFGREMRTAMEKRAKKG